jgi:hypothetical protein
LYLRLANTTQRIQAGPESAAATQVSHVSQATLVCITCVIIS